MKNHSIDNNIHQLIFDKRKKHILNKNKDKNENENEKIKMIFPEDFIKESKLKDNLVKSD